MQIINISMGTTENNPLIEEAVLYAHEQNVLIVAASGNSEQADACYPAAYPSVISVGAVDARGEHLDFSNYGTYLSVTAPGYAINAAWPGNRYSRISGTSASAPIVTGAIAATMSNGTRRHDERQPGGGNRHELFGRRRHPGTGFRIRRRHPRCRPDHEPRHLRNRRCRHHQPADREIQQSRHQR